jgi:hypothetical protein
MNRGPYQRLPEVSSLCTRPPLNRVVCETRTVALGAAHDPNSPYAL